MKRILLTWALVSILISSCSLQDSNQDIKLFEHNNIDVNLVKKLSGQYIKANQLKSLNAEYSETEVKGVELVIETSEGQNMLYKIRNQLRNSDNQVYFLEDSIGYAEDKLALVPSKDDLEYLRMIRPDGINHGLSADDVIEKYQTWNQQFGLKLNGAGRSWLEAEILKDPPDWQAFAQEVYQFCPNVIDQGVGSVEILAEEMMNHYSLHLWWD